MSCGDEFISNKDYKELHQDIKNSKCDELLKDKHKKVINLNNSEYLPSFEVKANAPIFSANIDRVEMYMKPVLVFEKLYSGTS